MNDITGLKNTEKKLESVIHELETRNAELEQFTYTVSHDLKSPMISIVGFMGILKKAIEEQNEKDIQQALQIMDENIHRMDALLKNVLELSRIGRVANPSQWIPFQSIIDQSLKTMHGVLPDSLNITMDNQFPEIYCDESRMLEVLNNLIENAVKFTRSVEKPKIHIGLKKEEENVVFYIRDNGVGIDERYITRIFQLFDKLNPDTEGTGVGLTICRRIIEVHGGTIWAESSGLDQGTTICFTLANENCRYLE